jgi:hypothetical protein
MSGQWTIDGRRLPTPTVKWVEEEPREIPAKPTQKFWGRGVSLGYHDSGPYAGFNNGGCNADMWQVTGKEAVTITFSNNAWTAHGVAPSYRLEVGATPFDRKEIAAVNFEEHATPREQAQALVAAIRDQSPEYWAKDYPGAFPEGMADVVVCLPNQDQGQGRG